MSTDRKRVFLGTIEIAGFYTRLALALRDAGVDCVFTELSPHPFSYAPPDSRAPRFVHWVRSIADFRRSVSSKRAQNRLLSWALYAVELSLRMILVLPWAAVRFDVFCFGFATNIVGTRWGYWDVAMLRSLGKRVIFMFHGADSRPPYLTGPYARMVRSQTPDWQRVLWDLTRQQRQRINTLNRYADVIIDASVHGHFHSKRFVDYAWLGSPCPDESAVSVPQPRTATDGCSYTIRILHAPSDRAAKGSDLIAACIGRLKSKGYRIDYVELHGLPHAAILQEIRNSDFVIDQLYSDFPLAGFASEAACQGRAAIVCGYLEDRKLLDAFPTHYCHPDKLESAVERLLLDADYRNELGRRAKQYVHERWAPGVVARKWQQIIDGVLPGECWFEPHRTTYVHGGGMNQALLRETVRELVRHYGPSALELDDKPALRNRLLELVGPIEKSIAERGIPVSDISGKLS
jgi:hypothetical protein